MRRVVLPGSDRAAARNPRHLGGLDPSTRIAATVVVRRRAELPADLVLGPEVISAAELAARYGADPADLDRVRAVLGGHRIDVVAVDPGSRRLSIEGTAAAMREAFGADLSMVAGGDNVPHRHRAGELEVPTELDGIVQAVLGLDDRPQLHAPRAATTDAGTKAFTPPQLASVYDFPANTDGAGQTVAIIELDGGYTDQELATYFADLGIPTPSVRAVSVDGLANKPRLDCASADSEVLLDIEVVGGLAPKADLVVYFAPNTDRGFLDVVSTAVHATPTPVALSISWGSAEDGWTDQTRRALDQEFADAAALGVTVCVAAGDYGAADEVDDGKQHCDFPASSPHVLACGGTTLDADPATGKISSETVWNSGVGRMATGGGVSIVFALPDYQRAAGVAGTGRGVPDVAAVADPSTGYRVLVDGKKYASGGTSAVAPLWAALVARIAQRLGRPLGLLQPVLYAGLRAGSTAPGFRDVTSGDNQGYQATVGWDPCTGLGSPDGTALLAVIGQRLISGQ